MNEDGDGDDPLEDLYVDKDEIDRKRLSEALKGIIGIDRESGDPAFTGFHDLSNKRKFLAFLLYKRALLALGKIEESTLGESPGEIVEVTGIPRGTVTSYKSTMSIVENDKEIGGYYIPSHAVTTAIEKLESS